MKRILPILIFMIALVGCKDADQNSGFTQSTSTETEQVAIEESSESEVKEDWSTIGYHDFLDILSDNDLDYTEEVSVEESFLSVERKPILIEEEIISVYEYDSQDKLEKNASGISKDGSSIGIAGKCFLEISWASYPHFFKNTKLIVNYVGEDKVLLHLLNDLFGAEFAGLSPTN